MQLTSKFYISKHYATIMGEKNKRSLTRKGEEKSMQSFQHVLKRSLCQCLKSKQTAEQKANKEIQLITA